VAEYRYDAAGNLIGQLAYAGGLYHGSNFSETALVAWAAVQDQTRIERIDTAYDFRGQVGTITRYSATDASGNGVIDGSQATTTYLYDQHGHLLSTIAPKGVATATPLDDYTTSYVYDNLGRLTASVDSLGNAVYNVHDDANQSITTQSANGLVTVSVFDNNGRVIQVSQYDGAVSLGVSNRSYDKTGRLLTVTDPQGAQSHSLHNGQGQLVARIDANGGLSTVAYDLAGNAVETVAYATALDSTQIGSLLTAAGNGTVSVTLAGIVSVLQSANDRHSYSLHDAANQLTHQIDAAGYVTQTFYDGAGRVSDVIGYTNPVATALIDPMLGGDQLLLTSSVDDRHSRNFYDNANRLLGQLDGAGYLSETVYDAAGNAVETIQYAGATPAAARTTGDLDTLRAAVAGNAGDRHGFMQYNQMGQLVAALDAEGYLSEYRYDLNGNQTEVTRYANTAGAHSVGLPLTSLRPLVNVNDSVTLNAYNALDQLASTTRKAGSSNITTTEFTYDEMGRLTRTDHAVGTGELRSQRARYDLQGRLVGELNGNGSNALDQLVNPTPAEIDAIWDQYGLQHSYDQVGRRTSTTDQNGHSTLFFYDVSGQLRYRVNAAGEVSETTFNRFGEVTDTIEYTQRIDTTDLSGGAITALLTSRVSAAANSASDSSSQVTYDLRGLISQIMDGEGNSTTNTYTGFGQLESLVRQNHSGSVTEQYGYDRRGLQILQTKAAGGSLQQSVSNVYDAFGRLVESTDARGVQRSVEHVANDGTGRKVIVTHNVNGSDPQQSTTVYDAFDRVLTLTDANGHSTTHSYDDAARRVTVTSPEGVQSTTERNRLGETVALIDGANQSTVYQYDRNGNLTSVTDANNKVTTSQYDHANRLIETVDANNIAVTYSYDAANRQLSRTLDPSGLNITTSLVYDGQGRSVTSVDANGIATQTEYDRNGRVSAIVVDLTWSNRLIPPS